MKSSAAPADQTCAASGSGSPPSPSGAQEGATPDSPAATASATTPAVAARTSHMCRVPGG